MLCVSTGDPEGFVELEATLARHARYYLSLAERSGGASADHADERVATLARPYRLALGLSDTLGL